jgi:hypothetical protein
LVLTNLKKKLPFGAENEKKSYQLLNNKTTTEITNNRTKKKFFQQFFNKIGFPDFVRAAGFRGKRGGLQMAATFVRFYVIPRYALITNCGANRGGGNQRKWR